MHILLSDTINTSQIDAAGQMLADFCSLLPELYDEKISTHNVHLLTHLTKYVKLWGLLWMYSVFGHENKNGCLKRLIHGKNQIHQQLLFSVDVCITLGQLYPILASNEDDTTMEFINRISNKAFRSNMTLISNHTYIVGVCKAATLTSKQCQALCCSTHDVHDTFTKLYKDGVIYRTVSSRKNDALRDDTICVFKNEDNCKEFGLIDLFITGDNSTALVHKLICLDDAILQKAGHPCRHFLIDYQEANLLGKYIVPVEYQTRSLTVVPIDSIIGKPVILDVDSSIYAIIQPNHFECYYLTS